MVVVAAEEEEDPGPTLPSNRRSRVAAALSTRLERGEGTEETEAEGARREPIPIMDPELEEPPPLGASMGEPPRAEVPAEVEEVG